MINITLKIKTDLEDIKIIFQILSKMWIHSLKLGNNCFKSYKKLFTIDFTMRRIE